MSSSTRFRISLRVQHPDVSSESITDELGLLPRFSWTAGDKKVTPQGSDLGGLRAYTYWTHEWSATGSLEDSIAELSGRLLGSKEYLHQLVDSGGRVEYFIGWFSSQNYGFYVNHELSRVLSELRIDLAFDIYPEADA